MQNEKIELRSKPIQDLIGRIPPRIIRYGSGGMLISIIIMLLITLFIEYPEYLVYKVDIKKECDKNGFVAYLKIPSTDIFKLKKNQEVYLDLLQFPNHKFGFIISKVDSINYDIKSDSTGNFYYAISIIGQKIFNYNCKDIFFENLNGTAEIKQKSNSIFNKIFNCRPNKN